MESSYWASLTSFEGHNVADMPLADITRESWNLICWSWVSDIRQSVVWAFVGVAEDDGRGSMSCEPRGASIEAQQPFDLLPPSCLHHGSQSSRPQGLKCRPPYSQFPISDILLCLAPTSDAELERRYLKRPPWPEALAVSSRFLLTHLGNYSRAQDHLVLWE